MTCGALYQSYYPSGCEGPGETCEVCILGILQNSWVLVGIIVISLIVLIILAFHFSKTISEDRNGK